jgi:hypothetical protein
VIGLYFDGFLVSESFDFRYVMIYILLLKISNEHHRSFHFCRAVLSTHSFFCSISFMSSLPFTFFPFIQTTHHFIYFHVFFKCVFMTFFSLPLIPQYFNTVVIFYLFVIFVSATLVCITFRVFAFLFAHFM